MHRLPLRRTIICALGCGLLVLALTACAGNRPLGREVIEQARPHGRVSFDVVDLTPAILATLAAHRPPPFAARFHQYRPPPQLTIAAGDTVAVVIWEAAANGLFGNSLAQLSLPAGAAAALMTRQAPNSGTVAPLPAGLASSPAQLAQLYGMAGFATPPAGPAAATGFAAPAAPAAPGTTAAGVFVSPQVQQLLAVAAASGRPGTAIPGQQVGEDGGISIPYAGRIRVAGRTPQAVARLIERRLRPLAIDPQALVVVTRSAANSVAVTGDAIAGRRVGLSPAGERLLQVIAAAGGAKAPVRDTDVELTRGGVTAGVPLAALVADPAQDIYAEPGDVVTVLRRPHTISVFGATGRNTAITVSRDRLSLSEALGKAGGLLDQRADARAVFVLRYEPDAVVQALGEPIATGAPAGVSPIVYRLDLQKANALLLARRFLVRDRDVIFVADAPTQPFYAVFQALQQVTGPVVSAYATCRTVSC